MAGRTATVIKDWLNSSLPEIKHPKFKGCTRVKDVRVDAINEQLIKVMSETFRVAITMEMQDGGTSSLTGVVKLEMENSPDLAEKFDVFRIELQIYKEVITAMERLILEKGGDETDFVWADCYYCSDNKFLFADLCESGYRLVPMKEMLDLDHIKLVMAALGRFHALSLVLDERGDLDKTKMSEHNFSKKSDIVMNLYQSSLNILADVIESSWESKWSEVPGKLRTMATNIQELVLDMMLPLKGKCDVVNHGDCTLRNFMFLYRGSSTPIDAKLIDFQASSWANVAFDLVCILHSSVLPQIREANLNTLLHTHWSNLSETCNKMGYKGTVPTLQDITSWYQSLALFGFMQGIFLLPIFLASEDDGFQLNLTADYNGSGDTKGSFMDLPLYTSSKVKQALQFEVQRGLDHNIF